LVGCCLRLKLKQYPEAVLIDKLSAIAEIQRKSALEAKIMRLLHTMIRVNNLDESLKFYCDALGMRLLRKKDYPSGEFTLAFVGYGDERESSVIELTHNWNTASYDHGNAFGHIAIGVEDIYKTCAALKARGVKVVREPGPMKHGGSVIAFIEDPSGYKIELIEQGRERE
jgi:lactoylglutathione lyase